MFDLLFELVCLFYEFLAVAAIAGVGYFGFVFVVAWCHHDPKYFAVRLETFLTFVHDAFDRVAFAFVLFVLGVVIVFEVLTYSGI